MPNTIKELKKIASAIPILGAPFVNENKTKRFVTDTSKFIFGILIMSLVKLIQSGQNKDSMEMSNATMDSSESMSMNMLSVSMFLVMYAQMRSGAMIGELVANQITKCCTQTNNQEISSWREHEIPKNWLSTLPLAGSFFKSSHVKDIIHGTTMDVCMYSLGTIAMMLSFHEFDDTPLEEPASIFRMYLGMALGMVTVMVAFMFIDKILSVFCSKYEEDTENRSYQQIP